MLLLIATLSFFATSMPVKSKAGNCTFSVGGKNYDLSPLQGKVARGDDSKISTYHYLASVCSNMDQPCEDIMTGQKIFGNVYQIGGEPGQQAVCWDALAKWTGFTAGALDPSAGSGKSGFSLNFSNGDPCRGSPRKTTLNMVCDEENEVGTLSGYQDDEDSCLFIINYPTKYACGDAPASWGINGTFAGNLTCISPDCDINPTSITVKGSCSNMMAVVQEDDGMTVWSFDFDECGGYMARGTLRSQDGSQELLFDMNMHHDGTVWVLVNLPDFPYDLMAWIELKKP